MSDEALQVVAVEFRAKGLDRILEDIKKLSEGVDRSAAHLGRMERSVGGVDRSFIGMGQRVGYGTATLSMFGRGADSVATSVSNLTLKAAALGAGLLGVGSIAATAMAAVQSGISAVGEDTAVVMVNRIQKLTETQNDALKATLGQLEGVTAVPFENISQGFASAYRQTQDFEQALKLVRESEDFVIGQQIDFKTALSQSLPVLRAWNIDLSRLPEFYDLAAQAGNIADISFADFTDQLARVGPAAQAVGLHIQDIGAMLGFLNSQGVEPRRAKTALEGIIDRLSDLRTGKIPTQVIDLAVESPGLEKVLRTIRSGKADFFDIAKEIANANIEPEVLFSVFDKQTLAVLQPMINDLKAGGNELDKFRVKMSNAETASEDAARVMRNDLGFEAKQAAAKAGNIGEALAEKVLPRLKELLEVKALPLTDELVKAVEGANTFDEALHAVLVKLGESGIFKDIGEAIGATITAGIQIAADSVPSILNNVIANLPWEYKVLLGGATGVAIGKRLGIPAFASFGLGALGALAINPQAEKGKSVEDQMSDLIKQAFSGELPAPTTGKEVGQEVGKAIVEKTKEPLATASVPKPVSDLATQVASAAAAEIHPVGGPLATQEGAPGSVEAINAAFEKFKARSAAEIVERPATDNAMWLGGANSILGLRRGALIKALDQAAIQASKSVVVSGAAYRAGSLLRAMGGVRGNLLTTMLASLLDIQGSSDPRVEQFNIVKRAQSEREAFSRHEAPVEQEIGGALRLAEMFDQLPGILGQTRFEDQFKGIDQNELYTEALTAAMGANREDLVQQVIDSMTAVGLKDVYQRGLSENLTPEQAMSRAYAEIGDRFGNGGLQVALGDVNVQIAAGDTRPAAELLNDPVVQQELQEGMRKFVESFLANKTRQATARYQSGAAVP